MHTTTTLINQRMSKILELDTSFPATYNQMKAKRTHSWIALEIDDARTKIKVVDVAPAGKDINELMKFLEDKKCVYVVFQHNYKSDDGFLKMEKVFLITYVDTLDRATANVYNLDETKKRLVEACKGAIEVAASSPPDVKRRIYGVSSTRRKTVYGDEREQEEEEEGDDWMDN